MVLELANTFSMSEVHSIDPGITNSSLHPSNPYYIHPGEGPGSVSITPVLTWSKWVFLTGVVTELALTDHLYPTWERCNTLIMSWLLNSLSQPIAQSVIFFEKPNAFINSGFIPSDKGAAADLQNLIQQTIIATTVRYAFIVTAPLHHRSVLCETRLPTGSSPIPGRPRFNLREGAVNNLANNVVNNLTNIKGSGSNTTGVEGSASNGPDSSSNRNKHPETYGSGSV
ncbi:hypothetical protein ACSQ67_009203 [Phaseolus vulgaris]